jgi:amino acid permease
VWLVTCDILGPFGAPYSIAQIGLVPGITLYLLFGIFAIITGFMVRPSLLTARDAVWRSG